MSRSQVEDPKKLKEIGIYYDKVRKFFTTSKALPVVKMQTRDSKSLDFIHSNVSILLLLSTSPHVFGNTGTDVPWLDLNKNVVPSPVATYTSSLKRHTLVA